MLKRRPNLSELLALLALVACMIAGKSAVAAPLQIQISGSTELIPLVDLWIRDYSPSNPAVSISAKPTGSGAGIEQVISGAVQIGLSDAYMSDEQAEQNPQIAHIPLAIAALNIVYNLPEAKGTSLKLDGPTLAGIYSGKLTQWDALSIKTLNPGAPLPHRTIVPIRRSDESGDTFIFTQFLQFSAPGWEDEVGSGTTVEWPKVAGERTAVGNAGMVQALATTPYSVGYAGISFADEIAKGGLETARVGNQDGEFLLPTAATINVAASELDTRTPADERLSLVFAPGQNSYPLINYEYAVVSTRQPNPEVAKAMRDFLLWSGSPVGGNAARYLDAVHFVPIPDFIRAMNQKQIARIK